MARKILWRSVQREGYYPICKLINLPVIIAWMLAEDIKFSSQRQETSLLMVKAIARASHLLALVSHALKSHRCDTKCLWWTPEHSVSYVPGEKHWAWAILCLYSKSAVFLGGGHYLIPEGSSLQTQLWILTRAKSCQSFKFLAHTVGMFSSPGAQGGLPLTTNICMTEALILYMMEEYWFYFSFIFHFQKSVYYPPKQLYKLICSNSQLKNKEIIKIKINILSHIPESVIAGLHLDLKYIVNCFIK